MPEHEDATWNMPNLSNMQMVTFQLTTHAEKATANSYWTCV